ncbi:hypothetical protein [Brevundimonas sp.]|nr:hypothetical protein [Brevundimonas sp.]
MKFLLDEHLSIGLVAVIVGLGHEAWPRLIASLTAGDTIVEVRP